MPVLLLDRLPLPSLPAYTGVSVALLLCSLYYAAVHAEAEADTVHEGLQALCWALGRQCTRVLSFMVHEPFCIWPLVNMAYCVVVLLGKSIQRAVFGELRVSESQAMKDTFWNFVFYKFIFVFGVLSVQRLEEVVLWCSWFTLLGFFHHLAQLARERAEYLSLSGNPERDRWSHLRLLGLLATILFSSCVMFLVCVVVAILVSVNTFAFMAAECILLSLRTLQTMLRYSLHLYDVSHGSATPSELQSLFPEKNPNIATSKEQLSVPERSCKKQLSLSDKQLCKKEEVLVKGNTPVEEQESKLDLSEQCSIVSVSVNKTAKAEGKGEEEEEDKCEKKDSSLQLPSHQSDESLLSQEGVSQDTNSSLNMSSQKWWVRGGGASYYLELLFELAALLLDLLHHIHMLLWSNILLSMASLVICMQLRLLLHQLRSRLTRHRARLRLQDYMKTHFPLATKEELSDSDNCAICWESLDSARKLPCTHLFHSWCLQSWLEQVASCPTCRLPLVIDDPASVPGNGHSGDVARNQPDTRAGAQGRGTGMVGLLGSALAGLVGNVDQEQPMGPREPDHRNDDSPNPINNNSHVFHYDGSRYVSWLPSFSVEAAHSQLVQGNHNEASSSQLHNMALQVQQMFPHFPLWALVADLRVSHSAELTVENILEGRLLPPPPMFSPEVLSFSGPSVEPMRTRSWDFEEPAVRERPFVSFAHSSAERQRTLVMRRETMLQQARRRYLGRSASTSSENASSSSSSSSSGHGTTHLNST